ncbi:MAG TPA: hypothetical protein VGK18_15590 [Propionicimonas sp.]|jgi:hypothetical protein|uniref:sunset domain-containing protein n=1 Tax=Propionicimonas sp. TaxID=1955623 RepID=UPI002F41BAAB
MRKLAVLTVSVLLLPLAGCTGAESWAPAYDSDGTTAPIATARHTPKPTATPKPRATPKRTTTRGEKRCLIKGNVSYNTGERIYHVPGQKYYQSTIINEAKGERWFCTEAQARKAGWRKSVV